MIQLITLHDIQAELLAMTDSDDLSKAIIDLGSLIQLISYSDFCEFLRLDYSKNSGVMSFLQYAESYLNFSDLIENEVSRNLLKKMLKLNIREIQKENNSENS